MGFIKEQDKSYFTKAEEDVEKIIFQQPISIERDGEYRIGIRTAKDGDYHAELSIYKALNCKYKRVYSCNALIGRNGCGKQNEGDKKTPLGTWKIGKAYGIAENPKSLVPYIRITNDMYWCSTGSKGKKYNQLIYKSKALFNDYSEDEHLIDYPIRYKYLLDIGYNASCVPYIGSAIFLHCWKTPDTPTDGCVGVSEKSMVKILQTITPETTVTIY